MVLCIIKDNYVIDRIEADPEKLEGWEYPFPHDKIIEDVNTCIHIGDWYEEPEDTFYRPIGKTPEDSPLYNPEEEE